jgi:DNA polymerase-3 subunit beta
LKEVPTDEVTIETTKTKVCVTAGFSDFKMPTEDASHFNDVPEFDTSMNSFELSASALRKMIHRTLFAAATEEGKFAMQGVHIDRGDGVLKLVATDGKRLAVAIGPSIGKDETNPTTLVPSKVLGLLDQVSASDAPDALVKLAWNNSTVWFQTTKATITSRVVNDVITAIGF